MSRLFCNTITDTTLNHFKTFNFGLISWRAFWISHGSVFYTTKISKKSWYVLNIIQGKFLWIKKNLRARFSQVQFSVLLGAVYCWKNSITKTHYPRYPDFAACPSFLVVGVRVRPLLKKKLRLCVCKNLRSAIWSWERTDAFAGYS